MIALIGGVALVLWAIFGKNKTLWSWVAFAAGLYLLIVASYGP